MFCANRRLARNGERTVSSTRRLWIDTRYLGCNCIIYVTTLLLHSLVDTREANVSATIKPPEEERTEGEAMRRDATRRDVARPFPFVNAKLWLLHRREASLCGSPNELRQKEGRGNGQMFSSSPTCAIPLLYLTRTTRWRPANREWQTGMRKGKHCWEKFRQMPFSLGSLHVYLMFNLFASDLVYREDPANYKMFGVPLIRFFSCRR